MTDEELAAIEAHAQAVDSPMSENCLRLIECLTACRTAKGLLARRLEVAVAERERLEKAVQLGEGHHLTLQREAEVTRERDRLREALKRYGWHESGPDGCRFDPCTCGLSDLVA
jgi:hypothetical protein